MQRDTKHELLVKGHDLAKRNGLGFLTSKTLRETTGFYRASIQHHYGNIAGFRDAVKAYGVEKGTWADDVSARSPRMAPAERKNELLTEAFKQAHVYGLHTVTRVSVANALNVSDGLISRYFGGADGLREAVLAQAVVNADADIVADAIELGMSTQHVPPELCAAAKNILDRA